MKLLKKQSIQLFSTLFLGVLLGVWQYLPTSTNQSEKQSGKQSFLSNLSSSDFNQSVFDDTAEIEPLLKLTAPDNDASVQEWYQFALSLDDLDLGKRFGNRAQMTPMLAWYALIAKRKPQALYKLYNQGKLHELKFEHLLRYGYLKYWDEYVSNVNEVLLDNNQAVLSMAYNKGVAETRRRVVDAFFKLSSQQIGASRKNDLEPDILLFAMEAMTDNEKQQVMPILEKGVFKIDPRFIYRLKLVDVFQDENNKIVSLIEQYSKEGSYGSKTMSSYIMDSAILGSKRHIKSMINEVEFNAKQPTNFYCAACGLALSTDGLIAYPLISAAKKGKVEMRQSKDGVMILSRKGAR